MGVDLYTENPNYYKLGGGGVALYTPKYGI